MMRSGQILKIFIDAVPALSVNKGMAGIFFFACVGYYAVKGISKTEGSSVTFKNKKIRRKM